MMDVLIRANLEHLSASIDLTIQDGVERENSMGRGTNISTTH